MDPFCAKCNKVVYVMEKLNCLDKYWHKGCFTCQVCNLKLTMNTYKGSNKIPYCRAHYPTTKFTSVAETPENQRLAQNTRQQSELVYRKDRKGSLTNFTQVSDSFDMQHAQKSAAMASQVNYRQPIGRRSSSSTYSPPQSPESRFSQPTFEPGQPTAVNRHSTIGFRCLFDYAAADTDEVSFKEGDEIIDARIIDVGWIEGRVRRTGQFGLIPYNYLRQV